MSDTLHNDPCHFPAIHAHTSHRFPPFPPRNLDQETCCSIFHCRDARQTCDSPYFSCRPCGTEGGGCRGIPKHRHTSSSCAHLLIDTLRYHGCVGVHVAQGPQCVALLQLPQPVEELHGALPHPGLAQVLEQQRRRAAVELEQRLEHLQADTTRVLRPCLVDIKCGFLGCACQKE